MIRPFKVALVGLVRSELPDWVAGQFEDEQIDFVYRECQTREELAETAGDADFVWVYGESKSVSEDNLDLLLRCGAILRSGSGTDNIPVKAATELGIIVCNTPSGLSDEVSDHAFALMFGVLRCVALQDRTLRSGVWDPWLAPTKILSGRTVGLVGFGNIARLMVRKLSGFDVEVIVHDPAVPNVEMKNQGVESVEFDDLFSRSDIVSLHCPLLDSTYQLIGERELKLMGPEAILINTSRGPVIDEAALIRALQNGWIAAAGIDVFEEEPADLESNPLFKMDNVVFTPHNAGLSDVSNEKLWKLSVETAIDLANGFWPRSYVNPDVKPKWELRNVIEN